MEKDNNKSYKRLILELILKIAVSIIIFIVAVNGREINNKFIDIIVRFSFIVIIMYCIYSITILSEEFSELHDKRKRALTYDIIAHGKQYSIDEIVTLAESNDIIEIEIVSENKVIKIGSSSYIENMSSEFSDKEYYIGDKTFKNISDFKEEILKYAINGQIPVVFIDGLIPDKFEPKRSAKRR